MKLHVLAVLCIACASCKSTEHNGPDASLFPDASAEWQQGFRAGVMEGILLTKDTPDQ